MDFVDRDHWDVPPRCRQCGGDQISMILKGKTQLQCGTCGLPADAVLERELKPEPFTLLTAEERKRLLLQLARPPEPEQIVPVPEKALVQTTPKGGRPGRSRE